MPGRSRAGRRHGRELGQHFLESSALASRLAADAQIAANLLMSVHWQFFRNAREHALAGRSGPTAVRRMRKDLERAYRLLEHGLGGLEASAG